MAITIDAKNLIAGRLGTYVAKKAMQGETINIVNSELAVITGKPQEIFARYRQRSARGTPSTGPFIHRQADRLLRRLLRGMVPYKQPKGVAAYKRIMCYRGIPEKFAQTKLETIQAANVTKVQKVTFVTIGDIAKHLGK